MYERMLFRCTVCNHIQTTNHQCLRCRNRDITKFQTSYEPNKEAAALLCDAMGVQLTSTVGQKVRQAIEIIKDL